MYLVFNRYAAKFFAMLTVINFLILIPIYVTGRNDGDGMVNELNQLVLIRIITLLNIKNDVSKVTSVFVVIIISYTVLTFVLMYNYWKKSYAWRHKEHSHTTKF